MAYIQKTVLLYIGKNTRPVTFITGSASTDVVAKEVFKSPVNPHINGRDLITHICGIFEICKV